VLPTGLLRDATRVAHAVADVTNVPPAGRQPYVGTSAFTHKAGLHASAIKVDPNLYQHMDPGGVGNDMRLLVSDMAGRASVELKGRELGFDLAGDPELVSRVTARVKQLEARGHTFEAADASFELMLVEEVEGVRPAYFDVESWRVITETRPGDEAVSEATVKLKVNGAAEHRVSEGDGPVAALDGALRKALKIHYPQIDGVHLVDYKVRVINSKAETAAAVRVVIESRRDVGDGTREVFGTIGVSENVIDASWQAIRDSVEFKLLQNHRASK